MNMDTVSVDLLFLCILLGFAASNCNPTQLRDYVSINCGSSSTYAARDGQEWRGDAEPKSSSLLQMKGSSTASTVMDELISMEDPVPHHTARLSRFQFSYRFRVSPGQKIIRLHFYPASYKGFQRFNDLFTVESGPFILLSNFSASITANDLGVRSLVKEYCINVDENNQLNLVFTPESRRSLNMYALVNGIEIISVPAGLSYFGRGDIGVQVVGKSLLYVDSLVYVDDSTALEIIHRQSIRRHSVLLDGDIRDLFGVWDKVRNGGVSKTYTSTWIKSVDVGFRYMVRLYFSNLAFKIAEVGDAMFEVRINDMIVNTDIDTPIMYRDYMVIIKGRKHHGKHDLLICLNSNVEVMDGQGPIKGFEIMKLSDLENSLASPNPLATEQDLSYPTIQDSLHVPGTASMIASVSITLLALGCFFVYKLRRFNVNSTREVEIMPSIKAQRRCRRFSLAEIQQATKHFSDENIIGGGGFGKVYKGVIDNEEKPVAIKMRKPDAKQGANEFLNEIEVLTQHQNVNLVSLVGYCSDNGEMMLVYEFLEYRSVANHLYKCSGNNSSFNMTCIGAGRGSLTWKQRLNICIGAGRGLAYLHRHSLIHCDVKASNILLDENLKAKVSDFGLAEQLSKSTLQSHVITKVKGTPRYRDPSFEITGILTQKSDAYSFGVFLLEVLSGRQVVDTSLGDDAQNLIPWARENIIDGHLDRIVDSNLRDEISEDSLNAFVGIAGRCLDGEPKKRPPMVQVVLKLEFALELQETSERIIVPNWLHMCE